jgi:hypothetical protein
LIITISDTCKNQPKRLDFDNTINLSSLIVSLIKDEEKTPDTKTQREEDDKEAKRNFFVIYSLFVEF